MSSFMTSANPCQQTRAGRNTNLSHQKITIYIPLSYHRTPILNSLHQKKNMKPSPDHSEFILFQMKLFLRPKQPKHTSISLHTWILTMYLTLLFMLSLPLFLNLEDWYPNIKTLWSTLALLKGKLSHNSISEIFRKELKIFCQKMKQDK